MQASILSLEFGEPRLLVREPRASPSSPPAVRARLARRFVKPVGAWNLLVFGCRWRLLSHEEERAHDESDVDAISAAIRDLDGEKLIGVVLEPEPRRITFRFDIGATLTTWPYDSDPEAQWSLYMPNQCVLTYRADGRYSLDASSREPHELAWRPLPSEPKIYSVGWGGADV